MKSVKDFCFPDGIRVDYSPAAAESEKKEGRTRNEEDTFVFTLNGLDAEGKRIHEGNRAGWIFCVCLRIEAAAAGPKSKSAQKVLCLTSYFEYFELFSQLLENLSSLGHMDRLECSDPGPECRTILQKLLETNVDVVTSISAPGIAYTLPRPDDGERSAARFFAGPLFSVLRPADFFTLMCNLMLERSVIFVSKNLRLLTSSM